MGCKAKKKITRAGGYITPKKLRKKQLDAADVKNPYTKKNKKK